MANEVLDRWKLRFDDVPGAPWAGCESLVIPVLTQENYQGVLRFALPPRRISRACAGAAGAEDVERARGGPGHPGRSRFRVTLQERRARRTICPCSPGRCPAGVGALQRSWRFRRPRSSCGSGRRGRVAEFLRCRCRAADGWSEAGPHDSPAVVARNWMQTLASSDENWLIHADLHYYNILAGNPDPTGISTWKAIDPQPLAGPTAYTLARSCGTVWRDSLGSSAGAGGGNGGFATDLARVPESIRSTGWVQPWPGDHEHVLVSARGLRRFELGLAMPPVLCGWPALCPVPTSPESTLTPSNPSVDPIVT